MPLVSCANKRGKLTRILCILWADVVVTGVQDIFVHEGSSRGNLSEERHLVRFSILDFLSLVHKDLSRELASVLAIERRYSVGLGVVALLEGLQCGHEVVTSGDTVSNNTFRNTSGNSTLDNGSHRVHGSNHLGLELRGHMKLDLLEQVLGSTKSTDNQDVLERPVLGLDGNDLVSHQLQDSVHDRLEALQDFFVGKGHVTLLNAGLGEFGFNTDINSPFLAIVSEICLDSVLEIHDTLGVDTAGRLRSVGKLHLSNLGPQNVAKVAVESCRTARVTRTSSTLGDSEGVLLFDFVRNQIDSASTTINNQDGVVNLEVEQTRLGAEQGRCFGLGNESQAVVVFVTQETSLDGRGSGGSLACVVPDSRYSEVVSDVSLLSVEHLAKSLLQRRPHGLAELEEVVGSDIDLGLSRRQRRQVDGVNVRVAAKHQLQLEPLNLLDSWLGIASRCQSIGDVGAPADHLLILIVVEDSGDLDWI